MLLLKTALWDFHHRFLGKASAQLWAIDIKAVDSLITIFVLVFFFFFSPQLQGQLEDETVPDQPC